MVHERVDARAQVAVGAAMPHREDDENCFLGGWCREGVPGGTKHMDTNRGQVALGG